MEKLFISIFQMSISASYLIAAVLLVRFLLRKAPKSMRSFLWLLVGIRLLIPFSIESVFSLIPNTQVVDESIYDIQQPQINMMTEPTDITAPSSQPIQNVLIPSVEKSVTKTQMAVMVCTKVWLFGLICMMGYMLISWLRLKNRVRTSVPTGISLDCGTVKIYQSDLIESPFLFGIISPRIYIPSPIADKELPYVIIHEMTHKKRKDYLIKPIGFLLLSVYWFNPFVWIAYILLCKDIELICDEHVIKKLGASCKKEYSQALLNSAVNRRMIAACPVAFGEVSVKERVKNVLNYKKPAFWVLAAAVLACIIVPVCFMTQKKAEDPKLAVMPEETDEIPSEDYNLDDLFSVSGEYEMINPDPDKYTIGIPGLTLQKDGQFSFGYDPLSSYLCIGEYELTGDKLKAVTYDRKYHYQFTRVGDGSLLIFDAENSSDVSRFDAERNPTPPVENGSIFVRNNAKTALNNAAVLSQTLNQELSQDMAMTVEELKKNQELLQEMKMRLIYEEMKLKRQVEKTEDIALLQEEIEENKAALESMQQELLQQLEAAVKQKEDEQAALQSAMKAAEHSDIAYKTIEQWAQAFCDRDGETIVKLAGEKGKFLDKDILTYGVDDDGKDYYAFGWSSPWPWSDNYSESVTAHNYRIISVTDRTAEILYYAWVSDPHVTVWREQLTYKLENDKCVITSETLQFIDNICTTEAFNQAYPDGIVGTMMDYYSFNGAGEALNKNAKANKASKPYADLFEPDTAAVYLLNLLKNPNKVGTHVTKSDMDADTCTVTLEFYEFGDTVDVQMIRPYGSDGIWIPYTAHLESSEDVASIAPYIATGENVDMMITEDAKQLEALFPNHHEFASNMDFPKMIDLNGDGVEEKIEMVNLLYNGGDGGYALKVTDTKTGKLIPLPDGYTEESGFPIFSSYIVTEEGESWFQIHLGDEKKCNTLAYITQDALIRIYERNNMYKTVKDDILNHSNKMIFADVISGCNIITYNNEETPVILLKSYISGFAGHVDTLGYVITELRLLKDNTWAYRHYFLLDSCDDLELSWQKGMETGEIEADEADRNNGISILPFDKKSDINFQLLLPEA